MKLITWNFESNRLLEKLLKKLSMSETNSYMKCIDAFNVSQRIYIRADSHYQ